MLPIERGQVRGGREVLIATVASGPAIVATRTSAEASRQATYPSIRASVATSNGTCVERSDRRNALSGRRRK